AAPPAAVQTEDDAQPALAPPPPPPPPPPPEPILAQPMSTAPVAPAGLGVPAPAISSDAPAPVPASAPPASLSPLQQALFQRTQQAAGLPGTDALAETPALPPLVAHEAASSNGSEAAPQPAPSLASSAPQKPQSPLGGDALPPLAPHQPRTPASLSSAGLAAPGGLPPLTPQGSAARSQPPSLGSLAARAASQPALASLDTSPNAPVLPPGSFTDTDGERTQPR